MKYFIILFLLLSTLHSANLNWEHNYYQALYDAKVQDKDVYLFIGADKCRWCDKFKNETLSNKDVIEKLKEKFVLLYMSRDQHKIPNKFKLRGVPWQYFLDYKGNIIYKAQGGREIDGFYDLLEEVDLVKDD